MRERVMTRWIVLFGLIVVLFIGTVSTLNLTLYSAAGFTTSYLNALARHDVQGALSLPGVQTANEDTTGTSTSATETAGSGSTELLTPTALAALNDIHLVSDTDNGAGQHTLVFGYSFGSVSGTSSFVVEHTGARLGLFSAWRFVHSPLSTLAITPRHGSSFIANSLALSPRGGSDIAHRYRVLVPAAVTISHTSAYLTSPPRTIVLAEAATTATTEVTIEANPEFVRVVSAELNRYLDACVTQKVLLPTGCPMGKQIGDRLQDAPTWSMVTYPTVAIVPGTDSGSWLLPTTDATAHLVVAVRSIFDGSLSTVNEDVPFTVKYLITFGADGGPVITAQP